MTAWRLAWPREGRRRSGCLTFAALSLTVLTWGGGLTDRTHTAVAYLPSVANTLTRRMHKGINTTVDEGQTPIVTTGGVFSESSAFGSGRDSQDTFVVESKAVAFQSTLGTRGGDIYEDGTAPTVRVGSGLGIPSPPAVAFGPSHFTRGKDGRPDEITPPLSADADKGDQDTVVLRGAIGFNWQNGGGYGNANDGLGITEEGTGPLSRSQVPACVTGTRTHALTTRAAAVEEDSGSDATEELSPTMRAMQHVDGNANAGGQIAVAYGVDTYNQTVSDVSIPLRAGNAKDSLRPAMVPFTKAKRAQSVNDDESWVPGEVAPTQNQFDVGDTRATTVVAFTQNSRDEVRQIDGDGQIAGALSAEGGMHQTNYLAFAPLQGGRSMPVTPESPTLEAGTGNKAPAVLSDAPVQVQWASGGGRVKKPTMQALRTSAEHSYQFIRHAMQVRRLTPTECCRLQGFPDEHCDITFRKKPAADGPKYRALGNSMAVPCMAWLGYRIHMATHRDTE